MPWLLTGILFFSVNFLLSHTYYKNYQRSYEMVLTSDALGYYQYLPAWFLGMDIRQLPYARPAGNGNMLNQYTCGLAILQAPFFFLGHLVSKVMQQPTTGYTPVYGFLILTGTMVYVFAGLILLFRVLRRHFNVFISLLSVLMVYFATNLTYYTIAQAGYTHACSFFLFSAYLYILPSFLEKPGWTNSLLTGGVLALAVLMRPAAIVITVLILLYDVYSWHQLRNRILFLLKNYRWLLFMAGIAFIVFIPQFLYWHAVTGKYLVYSYTQERFIYWNRPQLVTVLFGNKGGWLVYTPLMIIAWTGLFITLGRKILHAPAILLMLTLVLYINASWWAYTFAASFGHRGFVEYYAFLALPLAWVFGSVYGRKTPITAIGLSIVLIILVKLNLEMTFLYHTWMWDDPDWAWSDFLHKYLLKGLGSSHW